VEEPACCECKCECDPCDSCCDSGRHRGHRLFGGRRHNHDCCCGESGEAAPVVAPAAPEAPAT
jgi:hypothetical protein